MWRYQSTDPSHISLHDNRVDSVFVDGEAIYLIFQEGFNVDATHPLNSTGRAKLTTEAQIILRQGRFRKGIILGWGDEPDREIGFSLLTDGMQYFEVLSPRYEVHEIWFDGLIQTAESLNLAELTFSCSEAVFCWNDYFGDAWYQDWPQSP